MTHGPLWKLATRLWPELQVMDARQRPLAFGMMLAVFYITPLALIGMIWLVVVTDPATVRDHLPILALIAAVLVLMERQPFTLYMEMHDGELVANSSGSLASIVLYSAALILGPVALWAAVAQQVVTFGWTLARHARTRSGIWAAVSALVQEASGSVTGGLVALAAYRALGGDYPLAGLDPAGWLPAVIAVELTALLSTGQAVALLVRFNQLMGVPRPLWQVRRWLALVVGLTTVTAPFAVLAALIDAEAGRGLYLVMLAGVALVNYLAHNLSRTVDRSLQRARELTQLEALSEALIQAPPDLSTLEDLLREHARRMFPQERVEVRLFDEAARWGPVFHLHLFAQDGTHRAPLDDVVWDQLRAADSPTLTLPDLRFSGTGARGAGLLVKIQADNPGQEGGEKELLLGGISLLRACEVGRVRSSLAALQSLASQIASAYYRAQVHRDTLARQRMEQELALAGEVQARFLPRTVPQVPGWEMVASLLPARQTSGDFYDFVPLPDGRIGLVVADVADKGTGAALFMALSRTLIRTFAVQHPTAPEQALRAANLRILTDADSDQFVTVFYGVLDPASGTLTYANAGHNPAYLLNGADCHALKRTGVPLGVFEDQVWEQATVTVAPGDRLVLYSDGVSEAQDADGAEFGEDRMLAAIDAHRAGPVAAAHDAVLAAVQAFVGAAPQFDDLTLMIVARQEA